MFQKTFWHQKLSGWFWCQNQFLGHKNFMALGVSLCHHTIYGSLVASGMSGTRHARQMEFCWCWHCRCHCCWNCQCHDCHCCHHCCCHYQCHCHCHCCHYCHCHHHYYKFSSCWTEGHKPNTLDLLGDTLLCSDAPEPFSVLSESILILTPSLYYKCPGTWDCSWPSWKPGRVAKWAAQIFWWEECEKNKDQSRFLDWDDFWGKFWKEFCLSYTDMAAISKLESTAYFQHDYLDKFQDLILEARYFNPRMIVVVKFHQPSNSECHSNNGFQKTLQCGPKPMVFGSMHHWP